MMMKKIVNNNSSSCDIITSSTTTGTTATTSNTTGIMMMMNESGIKGIRNDDNQGSMHERVVFNLKDLNNRNIFEKLRKIKSTNIYSFQDIEKIHKWMMVSNSSNIHVQNRRGLCSSSSSGGGSSRSDDMDRTHHYISASNSSNNDSLFISKSFSTSQDNYQPSPNQQYHPHRNPHSHTHHQSHHSSNKNNHSSHHKAMTPNTNNSNTYSPIKIFNIYNNQSKHHYFNEDNPLSNKMITHTNTSTTNTTTNGNDNYFDNFQITEKSYSPVLKRDLYITMNIFEPTSTSSLSSSSSKQIHNSDRMKNVIKSSSSRYADRNGDISIDSIYSDRGTDGYDDTNHHRNHGNDSKLINSSNIITKHLNNSHDSLQRHPHHQLRKDTDMITPINFRRPSTLLATDTSIISIIDSKNKATRTKAATTTTTTAILTNTTVTTVSSLSTATIIKSAAIIATTPSISTTTVTPSSSSSLNTSLSSVYKPMTNRISIDALNRSIGSSSSSSSSSRSSSNRNIINTQSPANRISYNVRPSTTVTINKNDSTIASTATKAATPSATLLQQNTSNINLSIFRGAGVKLRDHRHHKTVMKPKTK